MGQGMVRGRGEQGRAGQGRAGQGRAGQGRAERGRGGVNILVNMSRIEHRLT